MPTTTWALKLNPKLAGALYGRGLAKQKKGDATAEADIAAAKAIQSDIAENSSATGRLIPHLPSPRTRPAPKLVLTSHVLDGFPFLECGLDCNKILVLGIFGMLFDGRTGPSKPSAPSGANRVFRKDLGQGFGELLIKNGNIGGAGHVRTSRSGRIQ